MTPRLAIAHGGEVVLMNFWIIVGIHIIALWALGLFFYEIALFYILIVLFCFFAYGCFIFVFWQEKIIDTLFFVVSYIVLLIFPFSGSYFFYKKSKNGKNDVRDREISQRRAGCANQSQQSTDMTAARCAVLTATPHC